MLLLVLLFSQNLNARPDPETKKDLVLFSLGLGLMRVSGEVRIPFLLTASYQHQKHLFTLRYLDLFWSEIYSDYDDLGFQEISLLYGLGFRSQNGHTSIAAGPSLAILETRSRRDFGEEPVFDTVHRLGLALGVQHFWRPIETLGFGIHGFSNLNSEEHLLGAVVNIQLIFE